jgi:riboflavin synthase
MFTGIIEQLGTVKSLEASDEGGQLRIDVSKAPEIAKGMKLGDSIAVNGCCLTVVEFTKKHLSADLSGETLRRTALGEMEPGHPVNLERPLMVGARLGGHFVQGHVDGVGQVTALTPEGDNWWLSVRVPEYLRRYVAEKGSIAIEGISLTVARWQDGVASIALIPFTYQHTNVHSLDAGSAVNLEVDILAKYVESLLSGTVRAADSTASSGKNAVGPSGLSIKQLTEQGF